MVISPKEKIIYFIIALAVIIKLINVSSENAGRYDNKLQFTNVAYRTGSPSCGPVSGLPGRRAHTPQ